MFIFSMNSMSKKIKFFSDGFVLTGSLHLPDTDRPPFVIGSHGLFSSSNSPKQFELARACNAVGIAFFRFDHRGCGASHASLEEVASLAGRHQDIMRALETLRARRDLADRIGLFGSSMGGAVCISVAGQMNIDALVTFAAPLRSGCIWEAIRKSDGPQTLTPGYFQEHLRFDMSSTLAGIRNILVFHGDADDVVPVSDAREIYRNVGGPKKLIIQRQGDHRMSKEAHQAAFIRETASWFRSRLNA